MKIKWDAVPKPEYYYGVYQAAWQARALGLKRMSAIEFGVAGGNGLVALEKIAGKVGELFGLEIDVYGFDTGSGMPPSGDYRDLLYVWQPGFFAMDVEALKKRLKKAVLHIGDLKANLEKFIESRPATIGFISFDMDYYTSTKVALRLLEADSSMLLPRTFCYFDDCVGQDYELHSPYAGELLAIEEFNRDQPDRKLALIHGLMYKRKIPSSWNVCMFVLHLFNHPLYNQYVLDFKDWQLELR